MINTCDNFTFAIHFDEDVMHVAACNGHLIIADQQPNKEALYEPKQKGFGILSLCSCDVVVCLLTVHVRINVYPMGGIGWTNVLTWSRRTARPPSLCSTQRHWMPGGLTVIRPLRFSFMNCVQWIVRCPLKTRNLNMPVKRFAIDSSLLHLLVAHNCVRTLLSGELSTSSCSIIKSNLVQRVVWMVRSQGWFPCLEHK